MELELEFKTSEGDDVSFLIKMNPGSSRFDCYFGNWVRDDGRTDVLSACKNGEFVSETEMHDLIDDIGVETIAEEAWSLYEY